MGREARQGGAVSRTRAVDKEGKGNGGGHTTVKGGPEGRGPDRQAPWAGKLLTKAAGRAYSEGGMRTMELACFRLAWRHTYGIPAPGKLSPERPIKFEAGLICASSSKPTRAAT